MQCNNVKNELDGIIYSRTKMIYTNPEVRSYMSTAKVNVYALDKGTDQVKSE